MSSKLHLLPLQEESANGLWQWSLPSSKQAGLFLKGTPTSSLVCISIVAFNPISRLVLLTEFFNIIGFSPSPNYVSRGRELLFYLPPPYPSVYRWLHGANRWLLGNTGWLNKWNNECVSLDKLPSKSTGFGGSWVQSIWAYQGWTYEHIRRSYWSSLISNTASSGAQKVNQGNIFRYAEILSALPGQLVENTENRAL